MGCASSKLFRRDLKRDIVLGNGDSTTHVVSLTSSTYGVLKLDKEQPTATAKGCVVESKRSPRRDEPEVINAWELMEDLEEEAPVCVQAKKSPKSSRFIRGFADIDARSPLKLLSQMSSPRKTKRLGGKENKGLANGFGGRLGRLDYSPKRVFKVCNFQENSRKGTPKSTKGSPVGSDVSSRRSNFGPLFDPKLLESFEKEMPAEGDQEQIKKMVSAAPMTRKARYSQDSESILEMLEKKCPPGGENAVIIYTTTLRGIRKTFEDCNNVRSIIESHCIQTFERDVSMDSGFREELRGLMETKLVKVPLVFVKGRLIGGADEIVKLEEEGKLGILFTGIPRSVAGGCVGCAGVRFVMCMDCSGSCKLLGEDGKKTVRCGECNENGLIQCPVCC